MQRHIHLIPSTFVVFILFCLDVTRFFLVARKLPCSWEGCDYSTLQRSNLETHYRRQYVNFHQLNASFFFFKDIIYLVQKTNRTPATTILNAIFLHAIQLLFSVIVNAHTAIFPDVEGRIRRTRSAYLYALYVVLNQMHLDLPV